MINRCSLVRVYNRMKKEPLKVWVCKDLGDNYKSNRTYLQVLKEMGLIEQVNAVYDYGKWHQTRRDVKGYRLKITSS